MLMAGKVHFGYIYGIGAVGVCWNVGAAQSYGSKRRSSRRDRFCSWLLHSPNCLSLSAEHFPILRSQRHRWNRVLDLKCDMVCGECFEAFLRRFGDEKTTSSRCLPLCNSVFCIRTSHCFLNLFTCDNKHMRYLTKTNWDISTINAILI